jgi:hypothetical protein
LTPEEFEGWCGNLAKIITLKSVKIMLVFDENEAE